MGRSVNRLRYAEARLYYDYEGEESYDWDDFKDSIIRELINRFPSLHTPYYLKWDGNETSVILENSLVYIGLSEYCGAVSVSFAPRGEYEDGYDNLIGLGSSWIKRVFPKLAKNPPEAPFGTPMRRIGTFSNGESAYERIGA